MDEDTLAAQVLAHLVELLRLAVSTVKLIDLPEQTTLTELRVLKDAHEALEVSTVMLLQKAGVTWEAMASELGVTRQSLNRRLSEKVAKLARKSLNVHVLEHEWANLLTALSEDVEEVTRMKPRSIAYRRARKLLAHGSRS